MKETRCQKKLRLLTLEVCVSLCHDLRHSATKRDNLKLKTGLSQHLLKILLNVTDQDALNACLPVCLPVCLSTCQPVCLPLCPYVCLSLCLSVSLPVCLFACLSLCLSVYLPERYTARALTNFEVSIN
jgi:hypothetical protein